MFRTLYSKLAISLFVIVCVIGVAVLQLLRYSSVLYQAEVAQKLNVTLADHIVAEQLLLENDKINKQALQQVFHMLMVINPSIELYLLDKQGKILSYYAPESKVVRQYINMEPVLRVINGATEFPIVGDDPRDTTRSKVFSAAPIKTRDANGDKLEGYLYIILGSEKYDGIAQMLSDSYILRLSIWGILAGIIVVFLLSTLFFAVLTRRLRKLSDAMTEYSDGGIMENARPLYSVDDIGGDEVDQLGRQFNLMVDKINNQMHELKKVDSMRRELVANVSHDLRTPITTLQGYLETLIIKGEQLDKIKRAQYLKVALDYSKQLSQLVTELFELSKLDSCESVIYAEPFSLAELIQDVVQKFQLKASHTGIGLTSAICTNPALVHGDIAMLQRALENLIENALRHTQTGGRVTVSYKLQNDKVIVKVSDTGCGIPSSELTHIFDRFYQVEKSRVNAKGAGLGLAIAKRILELHGTTIKVKSKLDHGTTFSFKMSSYKAA